MDTERGNLEVLFREIPSDEIHIIQKMNQNCHSYNHVDQKLYLKYARRRFPHYSEDERSNNYSILDEGMSAALENGKSIFYLILSMASKMLVFQSQGVKCRLDEMLRWREISFQLGQEFFICAFLAEEDLRRGNERIHFAWEPIIGSDDMRLDQILKRGVAENHFHLNGSTKIFELNWICLMNHIENRGKEFQKFERIIQHDFVNGSEKKEFYEVCQKAALYRIYLFAVLHEDDYLSEALKDLLLCIEEKKIFLWERLSELQDMIDLARMLYGAVNEQEVVVDYAFERDTYDCNNNACRLLSGERRFLYHCYRRALGSGTCSFSEFEKNVFYRYLVIRTYFRGEMVQVNRMVGFSNFDEYQLRKEYFVEGKKEYEYELVRLAVNASCHKQNIVSLEARICPAVRSEILRKKIRTEIEYALNKNTPDAEIEKKLFFVLHFPKQKDGKYKAYEPRDFAVRIRNEKYSNAIVAMLEEGGDLNRYIKGIDACANEIGCRPEVFAQYYRYLLDYSIPMGRDCTYSYKLMATYHAGEDFLDIVDGIRAIDEAMLFCKLHRGCRLGHALALGINPMDYYKFKGNTLVMPKQDLLDDIVWLLVKREVYGCTLDERLKSLLERKFYELFNEIYAGKCSEYGTLNYLDYYNSWMLRGDCPHHYLSNDVEFEHRLKSVPLQKISRYDFNDMVSNTIRMTKQYRMLYKLYHYDEQVRKRGEEKALFKIPCGYAELVKEIQDKMIQELVQKGIGIETNPSSNYLIGTIKKYEEHPITRFNGRKLKNTEANMSLQVSINTDDQGVFDTSLENEYALMTVALKKAKTKDNQYLYDIEDIYAWIDYVRRMGITQAFKI